jgi:hypothetical protein
VFGLLTVPDLSSIPLDRSHFFPFHVVLGVKAEPHIVSSFPGKLVYKCLPHLPALVVGKIRVVNFHMNARDESVVEASNPISCKENNTIVEFQGAEEAYCGVEKIISSKRCEDVNSNHFS